MSKIDGSAHVGLSSTAAIEGTIASIDKIGQANNYTSRVAGSKAGGLTSEGQPSYTDGQTNLDDSTNEIVSMSNQYTDK